MMLLTWPMTWPGHPMYNPDHKTPDDLASMLY
jgi:hypothetical protein